MNTLAVGLTLLVLLALLMLLIPLLKRNASRQLVIAVMMFLPLFSLSLYAWIGNPLITSRHEAKDLSSQEMQGLITKLSKRLATEPNDLEGWRLLAHSHLAQHNLSQAQQAFEQVHRLDPSDIGTTLSLIDVLVTQNQGQITQQAKSLIDTALQQEPSNSLALWFAYLLAKQQGDKDQLVQLKDKIKQSLPINAPISQQIQQQLNNNK